LLFVAAAYTAKESIEHLISPEPFDTAQALCYGCVGLIANIVMMLFLLRAKEAKSRHLACQRRPNPLADRRRSTQYGYDHWSSPTGARSTSGSLAQLEDDKVGVGSHDRAYL
jgi:Co/Zn/Cd efflux system component